ncbi:MAG: helix-turn-helix domain-containing protein [Clostridia bacterium]
MESKTAEPTVEKRCYTVDDICVILGVSRGYVYDLLKQKEFRWFRLGTTGRFRISKNDFDAWLENNI